MDLWSSQQVFLRHSLCCILLDCLYSLLDFLHSILCSELYFTPVLHILWPLSIAALHNMAHADVCMQTSNYLSAVPHHRHFHCLQILLEHLYFVSFFMQEIKKQ